METPSVSPMAHLAHTSRKSSSKCNAKLAVIEKIVRDLKMKTIQQNHVFDCAANAEKYIKVKKTESHRRQMNEAPIEKCINRINERLSHKYARTGQNES